MVNTSLPKMPICWEDTSGIIKQLLGLNLMHPALKYSFTELYSGVQNEVILGNVSVKRFTEGDKYLELFTYTPQCSHDRLWNKFNILARGLILDPVAEQIVALPFPKFFNYGEFPSFDVDRPFQTAEKVDGSLIITFFWNGKWRCATKGSFESDQAKWAQVLVDSIPEAQLYPWKICTLLFEYVAPHNRIVVDYHKEKLFLLSGYNTWTGEEIPNIPAVARQIGADTPEQYKYFDTKDLLDEAKNLPSYREGWVLKFENGERLKIKGDEYCRVHRLISSCTPLSIWRCMKSKDNLDALRVELPEEFRRDFDQIRGILNDKLDDALKKLQVLCEETKDLSDKQLGILLQQDENIRSHPVAKFIFAARKGEFFDKLENNRLTRDRFFDMFRPNSNRLEGYVPSSSMNRFEEES